MTIYQRLLPPPGVKITNKRPSAATPSRGSVHPSSAATSRAPTTPVVATSPTSCPPGINKESEIHIFQESADAETASSATSPPTKLDLLNSNDSQRSHVGFGTSQKTPKAQLQTSRLYPTAPSCVTFATVLIFVCVIIIILVLAYDFHPFDSFSFLKIAP